MRKTNIVMRVTLFLLVFILAGIITVVHATDEQSQFQLVRFAQTNIGKLNVRHHASLDADVIDRLEDEGRPLVIFGEAFASDGTLWYHAVTWSDAQSGKKDEIIMGWVAGDFVTLIDYDEFKYVYQFWSPPSYVIPSPTRRPSPARTPVPAEPPIYQLPQVSAEPPIYSYPPRPPR